MFRCIMYDLIRCVSQQYFYFAIRIQIENKEIVEKIEDLIVRYQ